MSAPPLILLLGGTSESGPLAQALLDAGWQVLVSTATEAPLALPGAARRRCGRLDAAGLADLCRREGVRALVDGAHPFAVALHGEAREAARLAGIPCLRFARGTEVLPPEAIAVADHEAAARAAFACGGPVLLTTGSRTLAPYVTEARRTGLAVTARVLDHPESLAACRGTGLREAEWVTGRGPFSLEDTLELLQATRAAALVTKESGEAGGVPLKAEAARRAGARLIVVRRPAEEGLDLPTLLCSLQEEVLPS